MQAHLFIFYFAQIQSITPPVCLASYTAASIAQADPIKTGIKGISIGFLGWIVPFVFVLHPEMNFEGSLVAIVMIFLAAIIGLTALTFALGGYMNRHLSLWERGLYLIAAGAIFAYSTTVLIVSAVVLVAALVFVSIILKMRSKT
jgi:TRAP-type uncharacterized transport system fused permease subunit